MKNAADLLSQFGIAPPSPPPPTPGSPLDYPAGQGPNKGTVEKTKAQELLEQHGIRAAVPGEEEFVVDPLTGAIGFVNPKTQAEVTEGTRKGLEGVAVGATSALAGTGQALTDALGKLGIAPQAMSALNKGITQAQLHFQREVGSGEIVDTGKLMGEALMWAYPASKASKFAEAVQGLGRWIPRMIAAATTGAAIGATEFQDEPRSRAEAAFEGAIGGAATERALSIPARLVTKLLSKRVITKFIEDATDFASGWNANSEALPKMFKEKLNGALRQEQSLLNGRNALGDKEFPFVDTRATVQSLNGLIDEDTQGAGTALKRARDKLQATPITIGGRPANPGDPLYEAVLKAQPELGKGSQVNYSRVAGALRDLQTELADATPGSDKAKALAKGVGILQDQLDSVERKGSSALRRAGEMATRYSRENVLPFYSREFQLARVAEGEGSDVPTWFAANKKLLDVATGEDTILAKRLYDSLPVQGRLLMQKGIIYQGLADAINTKGRVDPAALAKYLRDLPSKDTFFRDPRAREALNGLENVIKEASIAQGHTMGSHVPRYAGAHMATWGAARMLMGEVGKGGAEIVAGGIAMTTFRAVGRALNSAAGTNFLAAMGKVTPESPESTRLFRRFVTTFGGVGIPMDPSMRRYVTEGLVTGDDSGNESVLEQVIRGVGGR